MTSIALHTPLLLKAVFLLFTLLIWLMAVRKLSEATKLIEKYKLSLKDLRTYRAIEELHCREHNETNGKPLKNVIRKNVELEKGLTLSGKLTPKKIEQELLAIDNNPLLKETSMSLKFVTKWFIKDIAK